MTVDTFAARVAAIEAEDAPSKFAGTLLRRSELRTIPPVEPLIENTLSRRCAAVLVGQTGAGKTFLSLSWACSVATGRSWLGRQVTRCPVLYVVGEGAHGLDGRISAWEQAWGTTVADEDLVFSVRPDSFRERNVWQELTAEAKDLGSGFVILDTLSSLAPDADETKDAATFMRRLSDLAEAIDGTGLVVHHPGWGDESRTRGGSQFESNADEVLLLRGSATSDLGTLERKKVKEGVAGKQTHLRKQPQFGSIVIEAVSLSEVNAFSETAAESVARDVFGARTFTGPQLRDALMERLDISRTTAYEHIGTLTKSGLIVQAGGTDARPTYKAV